MGHPTDPRSNIAKLESFDPNQYALEKIPITVRTDEALTPGRPPCLTQHSVGMYLQPLTRELTEVPATPTIDELPEPVIDRMVQVDKAFWVDKPGSNAYNLHDAYYRYGMTTEQVFPARQDVFPRSYQYDLDCVKYRRQNACVGLKNPEIRKPAPHCRDCTKLKEPGLTPFQLAWAVDEGQKRWRNYPDLTATLSKNEIRKSMMDEVGRPFQSEACNWYNKNYPSAKYECIIRKFSK